MKMKIIKASELGDDWTAKHHCKPKTLEDQRRELRRHQLKTMTPEKWGELSRAQQDRLHKEAK